MRQYIYICKYVLFYVYSPIYRHQIKPRRTIDIDYARNLDIGTINCDQVDTDTMARLKLSKYSYLFFYFRFRPGWELVRRRWEISGRASGGRSSSDHQLRNIYSTLCSTFMLDWNSPDRIKHFKTLYIHSPLF